MPSKKNRWSRAVTENSHAMDLEKDVFKKNSARAIARSLFRSAKTSTTRKATPFRSAMSMLNFYVNRAGTKLARSRKALLNRSKVELRKLYLKNKPRKKRRQYA